LPQAKKRDIRPIADAYNTTRAAVAAITHWWDLRAGVHLQRLTE
jgi:hypothetical protein